MNIIIDLYSPPICDKMKFPCELLAEPYLSQLRVETAKNLNQLDYTQTEIAEILQVSQPVVSGYLKKSRNLSHLPQLLLSKARETANEITELFNQKGIEATEEAINIGCRECKIMRQSGPTCIFHKSQTSHLKSDCTACLTENPLIQLQIDKQGVIQELTHLFDRLREKSGMEKLIPEIGMQIVYSIELPESMSDIAAFPGRIIKRKNRDPLAETPTFGASETTSQLLLDLRKKNHNIRCITAIKTNEWLRNKLQKVSIPHIAIEGLEEDMLSKIEQITDVEDEFIIIGYNSIGYESISYACSSNSEEMINMLDILLN